MSNPSNEPQETPKLTEIKTCENHHWVNGRSVDIDTEEIDGVWFIIYETTVECMFCGAKDTYGASRVG